MINTIIDNLSRLENFINYLPSIIQIFIFIIWIIIIRSSKAKYKTSLGWSLFLLILSMVAQLLTLISVAQIIAGYSFMLLGVGVIQMVFTKNNDG